MNRNNENNESKLSEIVGQLTADKKKTVIALCLIGVMIFMWVKVFSGGSVKDAGAGLMNDKSSKAKSGSRKQLIYVGLPKIEGRNDSLTRDFFVLGGGRLGPNVEVNAGGNSEKVVRRIAKKLRLDAIIIGEESQAFINGRLLSSGDKLSVSDEGNEYECEITKIENDTVFIQCGQDNIQLKLR